MSIKHALERAVTELAQCISNVGDDVTEKDNQAHKLFDGLPGLAPLQRFDVDHSIVKNAHFAKKNLDNLLEKEELKVKPSSSKQLLETCISNLSESGFEVLYRVDTFGEFCNIAQIFIPKFDRLHLIRSGYGDAPNQVLL